ncbi:MAG: ADP-glyceromanno-heptose 6-epimerase [Chryseobacterium sp.]|nr:ADP-glyceromanno-heptose 6-epimerase [Chryseobacterium sp.]
MTQNKTEKIIITGAAGFIASCLVGYLNDQGYQNLILVDNFEREDKKKNWQNKTYSEIISRDQFFDWIDKPENKADIIIHLGAKTDTTEFNYSIHEELNVVYSQKIWKYCTKINIPLIYASSAATYGNGEYGYTDDHKVPFQLTPLNPYGKSKNEFDKWAILQKDQPVFWTGLKFFNVYGPNEYHKGRMASVILHSVKQIREKGYVDLFKSHHPDYKNGEQLRDFVYVKDLIKVIYWMMTNMLERKWIQENSGLYNLGTGEARSFYDLVSSTFNGLKLPPDIRFIDMPMDIRDKYQYFTQANMSKLKEAGYPESFYSLEEGVEDYVENYLNKETYY